MSFAIAWCRLQVQGRIGPGLIPARSEQIWAGLLLRPLPLHRRTQHWERSLDLLLGFDLAQRLFHHIGRVEARGDRTRRELLERGDELRLFVTVDVLAVAVFVIASRSVMTLNSPT